MFFNTIKLRTVKELIQMARRHAAKALPAETHQSYPIPVQGENPLGVAFLYCISRVTPKEGILLLPPSHRALLNAGSGQIVHFVTTSPRDFRQNDAANQLLGNYTMPQDMTTEEFVKQQDRLYQFYDLLMPLFAGRQSRVSADFQNLARQFQSLFPRVTEAPLLPYYKVLGLEFFVWLEKIAR